MPAEKLMVSLPSLIHRIGGETNKQLRVIAKQHNCELKRVRRSRNWQLIGEPQALKGLFDSLNQQSLQVDFVLLKLKAFIETHAQPSESLEEKLKRLLHSNSAITLTELMEQTGCSMSEARSARFSLDVL